MRFNILISYFCVYVFGTFWKIFALGAQFILARIFFFLFSGHDSVDSANEQRVKSGENGDVRYDYDTNGYYF